MVKFVSSSATVIFCVLVIFRFTRVRETQTKIMRVHCSNFTATSSKRGFVGYYLREVKKNNYKVLS